MLRRSSKRLALSLPTTTGGRKMAAEADKKNIRDQIRELRVAIDMNPMNDPEGKANIAYLEDALKHI